MENERADAGQDSKTLPAFLDPQVRTERENMIFPVQLTKIMIDTRLMLDLAKVTTTYTHHTDAAGAAPEVLKATHSARL